MNREKYNNIINRLNTLIPKLKAGPIDNEEQLNEAMELGLDVYAVMASNLPDDNDLITLKADYTLLYEKAREYMEKHMKDNNIDKKILHGHFALCEKIIIYTLGILTFLVAVSDITFRWLGAHISPGQSAYILSMQIITSGIVAYWSGHRRGRLTTKAIENLKL